MNIKKILIAALGILLISSCAIRIRPYTEIEPTTGETATLIFRNQAGSLGSGSIYRDAKSCEGRYSSGTLSPREERSFKIKSNSEVAISLGHDLGTSAYAGTVTRSYCQGMASFIPKTNSTYLATLHSTPGGCGLAISELVKTGEKLLAIPVDARRRIPANLMFDENSAFCEP